MTTHPEQGTPQERIGAVRDCLVLAVCELNEVGNRSRREFSEVLIGYARLAEQLVDRWGKRSGDSADAGQLAVALESLTALELRVQVLVTSFRSVVAQERLSNDAPVDLGTIEKMAPQAAFRIQRSRSRLQQLLATVIDFGGMAQVRLAEVTKMHIAELDGLIEAVANGQMPSNRLTTHELDHIDLIVDTEVADATAGMAREAETVHKWEVDMSDVVDPSDLEN